MLMELQKQQLQQLSDWLTVTEERIQKMESQLLAEDLESLQKQLEEHKVNLFCLLCNMHGRNIWKMCTLLGSLVEKLDCVRRHIWLYAEGAAFDVWKRMMG